MSDYIASKEIVTEYEIKKSRFITFIYNITEKTEVKAIIQNLRKEHPKANHVVYAWTIKTAFAPLCGSSDDGEPKGTAGRPVLEIILSKKAVNILVAVIRYFGGIKLGANGLVRSYRAAAVSGLNECGLKEDIQYIQKQVAVSYEKFDIVKRICMKNSYKIIKEDFAEDIVLTLSIAEEQKLEFPYGVVKSID